MEKFKIGDEVVRSKGDYVVGRIGTITEIDSEKRRIKGTWGTWVSFDSMELKSVPYQIIPGFYSESKGKYINPKYQRL